MAFRVSIISLLFSPESKNKTPKLNYYEAANYYQGLKTQNQPFGKRKKNKI
jgi:hypothetical protein